MRNLYALQYTQPPARPENIIQRDRLYYLLDINKNKPLILINASAGYGKTVLLAEYIRNNPSKYAWLTVSSNIPSPDHFMSYLIYSIKNIYPTFGENTLTYIKGFSGKWGKNNINELVTIFLNEILTSINSDITLIIDDFQNLECKNNVEWIENLCTVLFASFPVNLRFIISTRQNLPYKTSRLEAKRQLFVLSTSELCFDVEEANKLVSQVYNISSIKYIESILKRSGGWITAMHMLLQSPGILQNENINLADNLYDYIAEDIFNSIEDDLKLFLIKTAYLDTFDISFTDKLLNIHNSKEIVMKLISKNIFLESSFFKNNIIYFYQKLFSEFLRLYVKKHTGLVQMKKEYLRIAEVYIHESMPEEALWFLSEAGETEKFKQIINERIETKFDNLDFYTIERWITFSGDLCKTNDNFIYFRLKYYVKTNKFKNLSINEFSDVSVKGNIELQQKIIILKAEYLLLIGQFKESLDILNSIGDIVETIYLKKQYLLLLCKVYYRLGYGYHDNLIKLAESTIEFYDNNKIINEKLEVIGYLANIYSNKWEYTAAIRYYEMALNLEKDTQTTFIHLSNLIDLYSALGKFDKAIQYITISSDIYKAYKTPYFQRLLVRGKTKFYIDMGDYKKALKIYIDIENNESIKSNPYLMWSYYIQLTELYYFLSDKNSASQNLLLSKKYLPKDDDYFIVINCFFQNYYCSENILSDKTEEAITKMLDYHISKNLLMVVSQMNYYQCKVHLEKNLYSTAKKFILFVLRTYNEKKQSTFLETELLLSRKPFDFAISQNIEKKFIGTVFAAIKNKLSLNFISDEYREELNKRILRLTDLYLFPFGKTEIYLRGEPVPEDKWIRKKSKILLAYLMCDPEKIHTKDKIMDIFFDDMQADKADVVYHSAIYNIRTALKIYDIKSDKPKRSKDKTYDYNPQYILYEDKSLRLNPDFYYTSDNVEFEKHYNKTKLPSLSIEEKITHYVKAIELYKGDFLPGYYDSWCEELRVKYKNMYITLCEELIKILEAEIRYDEVIKYSELLLKEDKLNDSAQISIINAYTKFGNIKMAKSRYEIMLKIYDEELGEKPQPKTLSKINSILAEK